MKAKCPACLMEIDAVEVELCDGCSIYKCELCGLQFVNPIPAESPIFVDFSELAEVAFREYAVSTGHDAPQQNLSPPEKMLLRKLQSQINPGSSVVELYFESGRFMAGLQGIGYKPMGLDPLESHVAVLADNGFTVKQGQLEQCPPEWQNAGAVVVLESLIRLPDPVFFLRAIRARFPEAYLYVSVPSMRRSLKVPQFNRRTDYPPHHLTRWTKKALKQALAQAGYRSRLGITHVDLSGLKLPRYLTRPLELGLRVLGESQYSLVAVARPQVQV